MFGSSLLASLSLAFVPVQVPAFAAPQAPRADRVLVDRAEDGTVWARGVDYKLRLDGNGARFTPRERTAKQSHALELKAVTASVGGQPLFVDANARPTLSDRTATYDRGGLVETWDLGAHGARQNFVVTSLPAPGDLVLRMAIAGDLAQDGGGDGLRFRSPEGARVQYGNVLAFDASGRRVERPVAIVGGAIELRIPWSFLATATFPLFVDPLITTISVDAGTDDPQDPDVAMDDSLDVVLYVYEDSFASGDSDIVARRFTEAGVFLDEVAVDISNDDTIAPAVANHEAANQFLVVWQRQRSGVFTTQKIRGRTRAAASTSQGSVINITPGASDESHPDVGGPSSSSASALYYVVWDEKSTLHGQDIRGRTCSTGGSTGDILIVDNRGGDQSFPAITQKSGPGARWLIAYQNETGTNSTKLDGATVLESGAADHAFAEMSADDPGNDSQPDVAGDGTHFLVVGQRKQADGSSDIVGTKVEFGSGGFILFNGLRLTEDEPGVVRTRQQVSPTVAHTKTGFIYAYQEAVNTSSSAFDVYAASIDDGFLGVTYSEGHVLLSPNSSTFDGGPKLCSVPFGNTAFATWTHADSAGDFNINGAIYQEP